MTRRDELVGVRPYPVWHGDGLPPARSAPLAGEVTCDLLVVGAGLTGLWAAIEALRADPDRDVVVIDASHVGFGASGRNGGFVSASLSHGLGHGHATWPTEMSTLLRLGDENVREIDAFVTQEGIAAGLRWCGQSMVATRPHEVAGLRELHELHQHYGRESVFLTRDEMQSDVRSPTYLAGIHASSGGLVDPLALTLGLRDAAVRRGARIHENSPVTSISRDPTGVVIRTSTGRLHADKVVLATNAFRPLLRRIRSYVLPVWDHVLATDPLDAEQLASIGWDQNQGMRDSGNQFHYYRRTDDDRILWGGYDAIYYFGGKTDEGRVLRDQSHRLLADHFRATFPQLGGLRFSHRWAGAIDTTSRFTPLFGTGLGGRVAYAVGFTGLGVASSRFGARVALDLLAGEVTERTELSMVRRKPVPFPPEPLTWPTVQLTRAALAREDRNGRRGRLLRLMDRFGVGFDS